MGRYPNNLAVADESARGLERQILLSHMNPVSVR